MTIVRIARRIKSAIGWRRSPLALATPRAVPAVAAVVTARGPRHDPIYPLAVVPPPAHDYHDVPRRNRRPLPRLRLPAWGWRVTAVAIFVAAVQLATAAPVAPVDVVPAYDTTRPWFAIVLVSVNHEPLHEIAPGYLPALFYATRASCLAGTRASVREMAQAGIRGRFLCMYPREPDGALDRGPQERF